MKIKHFSFLLGFGGLLLASCTAPPPPEPAPDLDQIRTEIQALENAYAAGENAKDADAIVVYYADDAVSLPSEEPPVAGKPAILQRLKDHMAVDSTQSSIRFEVVDIFAAGNLVVEVGKSISTDMDGKEHQGKYMSLFEKRDGKYVCIRDMWNSDAKKEDKGEKEEE